MDEDEEEKKFLQVTETTANYSQAVGGKIALQTITFFNLRQQYRTSFSFQSPFPMDDGGEASGMATLTEYLWSIVYMPSSLRILCLTNLFCWMSLVCYSLYFTDFVGEAVFKGDPSVNNYFNPLIYF